MKLTKQRLKQIIREEFDRSPGARPEDFQNLDPEDESRHMEELHKVLQDCVNTLIRGVGHREALDMIESEVEMIKSELELEPSIDDMEVWSGDAAFKG